MRSSPGESFSIYKKPPFSFPGKNVVNLTSVLTRLVGEQVTDKSSEVCIVDHKIIRITELHQLDYILIMETKSVATMCTMEAYWMLSNKEKKGPCHSLMR